MEFQGINLLPQLLQEQEWELRARRRAAGGALLWLILLALLCGGMFYWQEQVYRQWRKTDSLLREQSQLLNQSSQRIREGKLRLIKNKITFLRQHFQRPNIYTPFFTSFFNQVPSGVEILSLREGQKPDLFELAALGDDLEQVESLIDNLAQWELVEKVTLQSLNYRLDRGEISFELLIKKTPLPSSEVTKENNDEGEKGT